MTRADGDQGRVDDRNQLQSKKQVSELRIGIKQRKKKSEVIFRIKIRKGQRFRLFLDDNKLQGWI